MTKDFFFFSLKVVVIPHCFAQFIRTKVFYLFYSLPKDIFTAFRERMVGGGVGEKERERET